MQLKSAKYLALTGMMAMMLGLGQTARAELAFVSGEDEPVAADGNPEDVAVFPYPEWEPGDPIPEEDFRGAGFPLWYQDTLGLRLTLCLDGEEEEPPCAWEDQPFFIQPFEDFNPENPDPLVCSDENLLYPYEHVVGFGEEAFYFKGQSYPFDVPLSIGGSAQLQLLLETTWDEDERFNEDTGVITINGVNFQVYRESGGVCSPLAGGDLHRTEPGYELLFARIRLRVLPGSPEGWYRLTHPYGVKTVFHPADPEDDPADDRTEVRQVIGDLVVPEEGWIEAEEMPDYTIPLNDADTLIARFGEATALEQYIGLRDTGFTNDDEFGLKSIGPFLVKPDYYLDEELLIEDEFVEGVMNRYIGHAPFEDNPEASEGHPIIGAPFFDQELGRYANYFRVQYQPGSRGVAPDPADWQQVAFNEEFNLVGKVVADCGEEVDPPVANSLDEIIYMAVNQPVTFDPFINDLPGQEDRPIFKLITSFHDLEEGAEVVFNSGSVDVTYVPVADQAYTDNFSYTLRDACGTESAPALLTVVVEDLQLNRAEYRVRTGRWLISGSTSHPDGNEIRLFAGPFDAENEEANQLIGTAAVAEDDSWTFRGKATASPAAGTVTAVSAFGIVSDPIDLILR